MNKKLYIPIVMIVLLSFVAFAFNENYPGDNPLGADHYYSFNESSTTKITDQIGSTDLTITGGDAGVRTPAIWGNGFNMTTAKSQSGVNTTGFFDGGNDYCFHIKMKIPLSPPSTNSRVLVTQAYGKRIILTQVSSGGGGAFNIQHQSADADYNTHALSHLEANKWINLTITWDSQNRRIWLNDTMVSKMAIPDLKVNGADYDAIGEWFAGEYFAGQIEEFIWFNSNCSLFQINSMILSNYTAAAPPPVVHDRLNISTILPANDTGIDSSSINFNASVNSSMNFNCTIRINDTINITTGDLPAGTEVNANATISDFLSGHYSYSFECYNASQRFGTGSFNENKSVELIVIDSIPPVMTAYFSNSTIFFGRNLTGNFSVTDNLQLHTFNITLLGQLEWFNITNLHRKTFTYNLTYNITNLTGTYTIRTKTTDGHTAQKLYYPNSYDWKNGIFNDYLKFEWGYPYKEHEVTIKSKDGSIFDSWKADEEWDSFKFIFEPSTPSDTYTFEVESDAPIYLADVPDSKYKKWLIIGEEHWLDFYIDGTEKVDIKPTKNPKEWEVTISNLPIQDKYEFNSIGDINIIHHYYNFTTTTATASFDNTVNEKETQSIYMRVNTTGAIDNTTFTMHYNSTQKTVTSKTEFTGYDMYTWTFVTPDIGVASALMNITFFYNLSSLANTENGTLNYSNTIYQIGIDNCSTYTTNSVNFTFRRDDTDALILANMDSYVRVWLDDENNYREFNLTWKNGNNHAICISPSFGNYTISSQFEYDDTAGLSDFAQKTYYFTNATIDNNTNQITLYLTPNSTVVEFTVTDQDDNVVQDVYIHVLKYDFGTNSHVTSEILKTDEQGEALGNIVLSTQWYKFLLVYKSVVVLETDPVKITTTSRNFRINLQTDFFDFFETLDNVQASLTFTNATLNFAYTFLNPTGTSVTACLNVRKREAIGDTLLNETCITAASGTILISAGANAAAVAGKTFIGTGTIKINPTDITDLLEVSFDEGYKKWGKDGIFASFFVRMALALMGIWSPIVALILLVLADIGMISMGLYNMSWTVMIFYIILAGITIYRVNRR